MWKNYYGAPLNNTLESSVEEKILELQQSGYPLKVCIGTDSMVYGKEIHFATALVFVIIGNGGCMFVNKKIEKRLMPLKERMLTEIGYSIETAYTIDPILKKYNVPLELHADINRDPKFASNASLKDAMGYIQGMGYHFVSKPDAYASSVCADRFCH